VFWGFASMISVSGPVCADQSVQNSSQFWMFARNARILENNAGFQQIVLIPGMDSFFSDDHR